MDNLRGFEEAGRGLTNSDESLGYEDRDDQDEAVMDSPHSFGADERRMHVRAYNHWAKLLGERSFPSIEDLDPENIEDFGPHSVLLDFTSGIDNPAIPYIGHALREECDLPTGIAFFNQVPARSLLSRITDHYMQIIANQAPIGFEAEFVNHRNVPIMYRGILLPFSSDDDSIDFVYGVINWKELADKATTAELIRQIDESVQSAKRKPSLPAWADGPDQASAEALERMEEDAMRGQEARLDDNIATSLQDAARNAGFHLDNAFEEVLDLDLDSVIDNDVPDLPDMGDENAERPDAEQDVASAGELLLADRLALARDLALAASASEDRSRAALYGAIEKAYDFALAADQHPQEFAELLDDAGLKMQDRAPMTPVVKLVFGADYDKTRLAEYACALGYAKREGVDSGALAAVIAAYSGGLKAIVRAERARRRGADKPKGPVKAEVRAMARLRAVQPRPLATLDPGEGEFVVLVARRDDTGSLGLVGALPQADTLTGRVLRKLAS